MAIVRGDIGRRVRVARTLAALSVKELARLVERNPLTVYRWEWGHRDPSIADCHRVAESTATDVGWLLTGRGKPRRKAAA